MCGGGGGSEGSSPTAQLVGVRGDGGDSEVVGGGGRGLVGEGRGRW